ncbi:MAG TPA: hypothetical protein VHY35_17815 [Stellaceae bacterium]|jgi:hypothetical protein|nr:hypothetical protein [Stellaceae bacterium]
MTDKELSALEFLAMQPEPVTAFDLGHWISGGMFESRRSTAGCGSNIGRSLYLKGFVSLHWKRPELYVYRITDAGRAALVDAKAPAP